MAAPTTTKRLTAEERREDIIEASKHEFARTGFHGTSTEDIARRAGISQPYLFRLFKTKKELYLILADRCFDRVQGAFAGAVATVPREEALDAMGETYGELLGDHELLLLQMQLYAASDDPEIRAKVQE